MDWSDLIVNTECVNKIIVVVSRLVVGRLSDTVKTVRIPVHQGETNITLALPCEDKLPYSIQVKYNNGKNEYLIILSG